MRPRIGTKDGQRNPDADDSSATTAAGPSADRWSVLATALCSQRVSVGLDASTPAWTDGQLIVVSSLDEARREVILQSALLVAGSLSPHIVRSLRGRPSLCRRYLSVEGRRALSLLESWVPSAALPDPGPLPIGVEASTSPESSLAIARSRVHLPAPPSWFGTVRPRRITDATGFSVEKRADDLTFRVKRLDHHQLFDEVDDRIGSVEKETTDSFGSSWLVQMLRRMFGMDGGSADNGAGGAADHDANGRPELARSVTPSRGGTTTNLVVRPAAVGQPLSGEVAVYPEWNHRSQCHRPNWTTVIEAPSRPVAVGRVERPIRHERLRRELAPLGLGMQRLRRQPIGGEIDLDAAIERCIAIAADQSVTDDVYIDNVRRRRELSVLVLLDSSSSGRDTSALGGTVLEHQATATAALVDTLALLGDRVAAYAFHSFGRAHVVFMPIKRFDEPFGNHVVSRLDALEPVGFTRLGAGIRHGTALLQREGQQERRLLVLISDGFPFDDDYEGRYAEADVRHALDEAHVGGVGCVCICVGGVTPPAQLVRTYGEHAYAVGPDVDAIAPLMGNLLRTAMSAADRSRKRPERNST
jgi:nitric oxide reductase NorD protein